MTLACSGLGQGLGRTALSAVGNGDGAEPAETPAVWAALRRSLHSVSGQ